jgi:hypothetical protein
MEELPNTRVESFFATRYDDKLVGFVRQHWYNHQQAETTSHQQCWLYRHREVWAAGHNKQ